MKTILLAIALTVTAPKPTLLVTLRPLGFVPAPATCDVEIYIDHFPGNRGLDVQIDGPDFFRSSAVELNDRTPVVFTFRYTGLPAGDYRARATLTQWIHGVWREQRADSNVLRVL